MGWRIRPKPAHLGTAVRYIVVLFVSLTEIPHHLPIYRNHFSVQDVFVVLVHPHQVFSNLCSDVAEASWSLQWHFVELWRENNTKIDGKPGLGDSSICSFWFSLLTVRHDFDMVESLRNKFET